ncbi:MAG TPA: phosphatase PAP2 family protein [Rhizomicrobium sp.]|jgi:acid phosphatase (class A)|nr:phosphatase PAP2 family protein [Rhizomicrobium sp.]
MKRALFALLFLFAGCGLAEAALLGPAQIDATHLLPPPPAAGSSQAQAEVAELHAIAGRAAPDMMAAAKRDAGDERPDLFNNVLGFDVTSLPVTSKLLSDVVQEQSADVGAAKKFFHRDRPWIVDSSIATCEMHAPGPAKNSYPSGHATLAFSTGVVLAALIPDKAQAILERAREYAENRLVCGMHFRSDIMAGQDIGTIVAVRLMQDSRFATEMDAARAELRSQHRIN